MASKRGKKKDDVAIDDDMIDEGVLPEMPGGEPQRTILDDRADEDFETLIAELGSGARVKIARINESTGNAAHVGEMKAEDFSLDALADVYGGGIYMLQMFRGKEKVGPRYRQEVDASIPQRNPRNPRGAQPQAAPTDMFMAFLTASAEQQHRSMEMMMTMMQGFSTAMMASMKGRESSDPLDTAIRLAELTKAASQPPQSFSAMREMMEFLDAMRGERGDGDPTLPLITKAIDGVVKIAERAPLPKQPVTPLPIPMQTPPKTVDTSAMRPWHAAVIPNLPMIRSVVGTLDPSTVADILEQRMSEEAFVDLCADITATMNAGDPITPDACGAFARGAAQHFGFPNEAVPWLAQVAAEVLTIYNDSADEGDANATP